MSEVAQSAPASPEPAPAKQSTVYLVLSKDADKDWWLPVGKYSAASAKAAVAACVKDKAANAGSFVAVPARSWQPVALSVETTTKIKLT